MSTLAMLEPFQRQISYTIGGVVLFTLYMFMTDVLRVIKVSLAQGYTNHATNSYLVRRIQMRL